MHLLYSCMLLSSYSLLYCINQPWKKPIIASCKCWKITHIDKTQIYLHLHIYQTNTLTRTVPWPSYFTPFHKTNREKFFNPTFVSCSSWKWLLGVRIWYCNKIPILWVCVEIIQRILSELMEVKNISQKSVCPHFCDSTRNTIIKTHRFQKIVARHMHNFLHRWYTQISIPFIDLAKKMTMARLLKQPVTVTVRSVFR